MSIFEMINEIQGVCGDCASASDYLLMNELPYDKVNCLWVKRIELKAFLLNHAGAFDLLVKLPLKDMEFYFSLPVGPCGDAKKIILNLLENQSPELRASGHGLGFYSNRRNTIQAINLQEGNMCIKYGS